MSTRREFISHLTLLAAAGLLPTTRSWSQIAPTYTFPFKKLPYEPGKGGDVIVISGIENGGNVLILPSEKGTIVVDAKHAYSAPDLLKDIQTHINGEPGLLITTHHHMDHSGGNWIFKPKTEIIAQTNFYARIEPNLVRYAEEANQHYKELSRKNPNDPRLPALAKLVDQLKTFSVANYSSTKQVEESETVTHGGVEIVLKHFGNGHTDNDLVVFFPKLNLMHTGDLLFYNLHPFIDRNARGTTVGWQNSLRKMLEMCDDNTIVVPGHGEVANKAALQAQIEYFDVMRAAVEKAREDGRGREFIVNMHPEQYANYGFPTLQPRVLGVIYDELTEPTG